MVLATELAVVLSKAFWQLVRTCRSDHRFRRTLLLASGCLVGLSLGGLASELVLVNAKNREYWLVPTVLVGIGALLALASAVTSYTDARPEPASLQGNYREEIRELTRARVELEKRIRESPGDGDPFDRLQLNLNQLTEYYTINKSQARRSFSLGASSVGIGLIVLVAGIAIFYFRDGRTSVQLPVITGLAGLLSQFIGACCFYLYNKAQKQVGTFYTRLSQVQDTLLAVDLCKEIQDSQARDLVIAEMIVRLTGRPSVERRDRTTTAQEESTNSGEWEAT